MAKGGSQKPLLELLEAGARASWLPPGYAPFVIESERHPGTYSLAACSEEGMLAVPMKVAEAGIAWPLLCAKAWAFYESTR